MFEVDGTLFLASVGITFALCSTFLLFNRQAEAKKWHLRHHYKHKNPLAESEL